MYDSEQNRNQNRPEAEPMEVGTDTDAPTANAMADADSPKGEGPDGDGSVIPPSEEGGGPHGECCDDCRKTCKRNFWTSVLNAIVKISTIVLAAFGIQSFTDPPQPSL